MLTNIIKYLQAALCAAFLLFSASVFSSAPMSSMHNHHHHTWMFGVSYMHMSMNGNLVGTRRISTAELLKRGYMMVPLRMNTDRLMLSAMYMFGHHTYIMLMVPYLWKSMDDVNKMGKQFTTNSSGIGDTKLILDTAPILNERNRLDLNAGVSFPTGSINARDDTPMHPNHLLGYPMQLGSGTYNIVLGVVYALFWHHWQWGFGAHGIIHLGRNKQNYAFGDSGQVNTSITYVINHMINIFLLTQATVTGKIQGMDARLNPMMMPTADPNLQGGKRIGLFVGINLLGKTLFNHRSGLQLIGGAPVYQNLNGPQMRMSWSIMLRGTISV